jgi:hypothetical protein
MLFVFVRRQHRNASFISRIRYAQAVLYKTGPAILSSTFLQHFSASAEFQQANDQF